MSQLELINRVNNFWDKLNDAAAVTGRRLEDIKVVPAVKTQTAQTINCLCAMGFDTVGENRADEVVAKHALLTQGIDVHFIGQLQSNKVKQIIDKVSMVQSLDRSSLAKELNRLAENRGIVMPVLVEVNMGEEPNKGGILPKEARDFCAEVASQYPALRLSGIMCVMPLGATRPLYLQAAKLYDILVSDSSLGESFRYLSMGMSDDFVTAVECGANMIRPGKVLLGERSL